MITLTVCGSMQVVDNSRSIDATAVVVQADVAPREKPIAGGSQGGLLAPFGTLTKGRHGPARLKKFFLPTPAPHVASWVGGFA